eukprot:CAMPEP_0177618294 /NCGR_PEP_ID=MMETSP0419_2-20121207/25483_1 /TAXON_ID=582737 /ORGANISM="Tetraselmis sp., Strain GSL018" /LENGTH=47 /DNA_ID= /DNA_START= /DNA_END= /DNA_ORIENTATION=
MASPTDVLQQEIDRLENAVFHLVRSNSEMKTQMKDHGPDRDLREAIQ